MPHDDEVIAALRQALEAAPENLPLRRHLIQLLVEQGQLEQAAQEYRQALERAPRDPGLQLGLAQVFRELGKIQEALVLVEALLGQPDPPARAHLLHARLLLATGEVEQAVIAYRAGQALDGALRDEELEGALGLGAGEHDPVVEGKERWGGLDPGALGELEAMTQRTTFADVGGMEQLKEEIRLKIIHPLTNPELYRAYGKAIGGGILIYGPPGCGKTHLARATAGEVKASFISVGINDVLEMWIGQSERNLHAIFEQARQSRPCVLFFDEVDALGAARADMRGHGGRQVINQFLAELDGIDAVNDGLLILAATNAPWHLDPAFRRPGRFDRVLFVPPPDQEARAAILRLKLEGKPQADVDHQQVARRAEDFSGADLEAVVDRAVEAKLQVALQKGAAEPITTKDLLRALKGMKPTTREWFSTARNHALYANQGGIYDDILDHLKLR